MRRGLVFAAIGLLLYGLLYAASEALVYRHALRNRFYMVRTASVEPYGAVILGASHALPLDFAEMNAEVERAANARVINLAMPGAGVIPNRLVLEYFLTAHRANAVVYVLDSFVVTSRQWNEDRLGDVKLLQRAPFDPALAGLMTTYAARGLVNPVAAVNYVSGFPKINDADRFGPDRHEMEGKFEQTARPSDRSAKQRIAYLYPPAIDDAAVDGYVGMLRDLVGLARSRGMTVTIVKLPVPAYYAALLPREAELTTRIRAGLDDGVLFYDLSRTGNDDRFFFDTDHLNRDGVRNILSLRLGAILRSVTAPAAPAPPP